MARTICLLTVALLLASTASALPSLSLLPSDDTPAPVTAVADRTTTVLEHDLSATDLADDADVAGALACRAVVRIDLTAWAYDITDTRERDSAFLTPFATGVREVLRTVPVTETRTETVWGPGGLLGFLQPVTRTVTEVVGFETETIEVQEMTELHISLAWAEDHLEVTELTETAYVSLPAGVPVLAQKNAEVVTLCDPEVQVLAHIPTIDCSGYDGCSELPLQTGWYARLLDLDVRLAEATDQDLPLQDARGWTIGGQRLDDRIRMEVGALVPDPAEDRLPTEAASRDSAEAGSGSDAALQSASTSLHVPTQTALFVALAAFLVLGLATVGIVLLRMRR